MLFQTGPGLTAEPRHGQWPAGGHGSAGAGCGQQWGPWTRLNQGSSDGAHGCGLMEHCREDGTGPGHGYARGRGDRARTGKRRWEWHGHVCGGLGVAGSGDGVGRQCRELGLAAGSGVQDLDSGYAQG